MTIQRSGAWLRWTPVLTLAVTTAICLVRFEPLLDGHQRGMGIDYVYFLPHLLGDYQWFRLNGYFAVPWFTPAFCGGLPDWANPQSMAYSLPQWLVFFVDPVRAIQIAFAIYSLVGAAGAFVLLRQGFRTSTWAALLGSVLFQFNGFFLARMIVGHPQFGLFTLTPWLAWLTIRSGAGSSWPDRITDVLLSGLVIAAVIHGGAVLLLPPMFIACAALGLIHAIRYGLRGRQLAHFLIVLGSAFLIALLLSASKLSASAAFTSLFPRDMYPIPQYRSFAGFVRAAATAMFWRAQPVIGADMFDPPTVAGVQENEYTLSPVPAVLILIALTLHFRRISRAGLPLIALIAVLLLPAIFNLHFEGWTQLLKAIPFLKSTSTFFRWFSGWIPVLCVGAALALDALPGRTIVATAGIVIAIAFAITGRRDNYLGPPYEPSSVVHAWNGIRASGNVPSIDHIYLPDPDPSLHRVHRSAEEAFTSGATNARCYEPAFGYVGENFPLRGLRPGPALDVADGRLNVKNPACFLFPKENACAPGDQFSVESRTDAEAFLGWEPIPFHRPLHQSIADWISVFAVATVPLVLVATMFALRRRRLVAQQPAGSTS